MPMAGSSPSEYGGPFRESGLLADHTPEALARERADRLTAEPTPSDDDSISRNPGRIGKSIAESTGSMNFRSYVYLAIRRSEPKPQNVAGIFWQLGSELGIHSEEDQGKFPTLEDLSRRVSRILIELGRIVEVSPHFYREATYGSVARNFSGVSADEDEKGRSAYFHQLTQSLTYGWKFDPVEWPGPDRARWGMGRRNDVVVPSPDNRFACVLYSYAEINVVWTVGLLAVLKGPPEQPTVILQPPEFTCNCIQWLDGSRLCAVVPVLYDSANNRINLIAITFLDLINETFAHFQPENVYRLVGLPIVTEDQHWVIRTMSQGRRPAGGLRIDPMTLKWHSWYSLDGRPEIPPAIPPDIDRGGGSIEVPY